MDDDLDLDASTSRGPQVPFPKGGAGPRVYLRLTGALLRGAAKEFGVRPFLAVAAEALAVPLLLLAIQAAVLAVASSLNVADGRAILGVRGMGIEVPAWGAAAVVLAAGCSSGLLSYYGRSRINKFAIRYEQACARRAVAHFLSHPADPNVKQAVALARVDSRSCGSALRLLLLSLPWGLALLLILPLLFWIQWAWTLLLAIAGLAAALALLTLNRRTVEATRNFDALRDASGLELASLLKSKGQPGNDPAEWAHLHAEYLESYEHRLQVPVRTQAITTILFAISLALIVPLVVLGDAASQMDLILLVFYLILLRIGFGYLGRVATLLMTFNQQFPYVRRYLLTIRDAPGGPARALAEPKDPVDA